MNNLRLIIKRIKNIQLTAAITVESSIIYPIIICIFVSIIILSFNLHDYVVNNSIAYRTSIYNAIQIKNDDDTLLPQTDDLYQEFQNFVFLSNIDDFSINSDDNSSTVEIKYNRDSIYHSYNNFLHCDKIRKYSVIFDFINNQTQED